MAQAFSTTKTTITLELTEDEAKAVYAVAQLIGGHPSQTARGQIDSVAKALREAGIRVPDVLDAVEGMPSIIFTKTL